MPVDIANDDALSIGSTPQLPWRPQTSGINPGHHFFTCRDRLDEIARYALERAYVETRRPRYHAGKYHLPVALRARWAIYCSKAGIE
jgi:hypothetical protein